MEAKEPSTQLVLITPGMARKWLENSAPNRKISRRHVAALKRDIIAGKWALNGDSIKFGPDGQLIDGQHRLEAISQAGVPVESVIVYGLSSGAQETVDTGIVRRFHDQLNIHGQLHYTVVAAVARRIFMWERGEYASLGAGRAKPTHSELWAIVNRYHGLLEESARFSATNARKLGVPKSTLGLAYFLFHNIDTTDAAKFLDNCVSGSDLPYDDPAMALRRRIQNIRDKGGRVNESQMLALVINAWNAHRRGEKRQRIQDPKGGLTSKNFPMPI